MEYFKLKNHLYLNSFTNNEISQYNLTTDRHPWREKPMRERANRRTTATCRLRFAPAQIAEYRNFGMWQNVVRHSKTHLVKMKVRDEKLKAIIDWSKNNRDIRAVLLTSSLVNPLAPVDDFSDLDIELIFENNAKYISDNTWTENFGNPIAMVEEDETYFEGKHAMKMVLYADYVKVDFKLYSKPEFLLDAKKNELHEDWDIGYKVLVDKEGLTNSLKKPTHQIFIIKKPTEKKFKQVLNDFWWDIAHTAKCIIRDDLFYTKFMTENNIRTDYLIPLIEWYISSEHNWNITTNKYGRLFKKYLTTDLWETIEQTFSGSKKNDNWDALFAMADLVSKIGTELSKKLNYDYPKKLEKDIRKYLDELKTK